MENIHTVSYEEFQSEKFNTIENFGFIAKRFGTSYFFVMNTVEPKGYGADCDYSWVQMTVASEDDLGKVGHLIHQLFGVDVDVSSLKAAKQSIQELLNKLRFMAETVDYGACKVKRIPFADQFRKTNLIHINFKTGTVQ